MGASLSLSVCCGKKLSSAAAIIVTWLVTAFCAPKTVATIALTSFLWLGAGTVALAGGRSTPLSAPIRLSDKQMGQVIAGGRIEGIYSAASGPPVMASAAAAIPSANATALREKTSPPSPARVVDPAQTNPAKRSEASLASYRLSDVQMDRITAGGPTMNLNLAASAQGPVSITSTAGGIASGQGTVLEVDLSSATPAHLISSNPATVIIATGAAIARGADGAQCSADIETTGFFPFLTVTSQTSRLPPSGGLPAGILCACSAFALIPSPH
jgi:hypothetical protein